jgi:ABC-type transporter Mla maintaining outer membrane lipid asymmetry ATPase subunit MlaF
VTPPIELTGVVKDYRGLRPLRVESLRVGPADRVALLGIDQPSAEVLINLITGSSLADRGSVRIFGQSTTDIQNSTDWLAFVDRFGIVSERAVLLEAMTIIQNLCMPFSLDIEPPSADVLSRAEPIAREIGLAEETWNARVSELDAASRWRVRLGRALALDPAVLLLEHPTVGVARESVEAFAREIGQIVAARSMAALTLTADAAFAHAFASRVMKLDPASGRSSPVRSGWLSRLRS